MFAFIKGVLAYSSGGFVVIEVGGVGYKIMIPANLYATLPPVESELVLHTAFIVRELSHTLYGFLTSHDRDIFEALLGVTGIGPKIALSLIGHMNAFDLHKAIQNGDTLTICKVPGIGKKGAERLIMEMRDKLGSLVPNIPADFGIQLQPSNGQRISDAMNALINLGYNQITAQKAIKQALQELPEDIDLPVLITRALKNV